MKKINSLLCFLILLFSIAATAQNQYGRNDRSERYNTQSTESQKAQQQKDLEKEKGKYIEKTVTRLKTDLELDALQEVAIRQIITESARIEGIIMNKKDESDEDKATAINALSETTDTKITALLNPTQKEKLLAFKSNYNKKKK